MIEVWRERWPVAAAAAVSLLLAVMLFALIWAALHSPEPIKPEARIVRVLLVRPPPPPSEPVKETVQPIVQAPLPHPVPPTKLIEARRDSVAASSVPKPKPAPPQPKTHAPAVADPLSLDEPPDWRQTAPPQGANAGYVIGGNGDNGGGSGCGGANIYLSIITSQLRNVFTRNQETDSRTFQVQAQLWFDDMGNVQRSQLMQSTGSADLDATVRKLLAEIDIGEGVPQCFQPIAVWVSQPWTGVPLEADDSQVTPSHVEVWQMQRHR